MPKSRAIVLFGVAVTGLVVLINARPVLSQQTLVVEAHDDTDRYSTVDLRPKGLSVGDETVIKGPLFDPSSAERIGSYHGIFERVRLRGGLHEATLTVSLGGNVITVAGNFDFKKFPENGETLAITGGTGDYFGASGAVIAEFLPDATRLTFDFSP